MSKSVPSATQPVRNALVNLATSLVAKVAAAFLFITLALALSLPALSAPPAEVPPPFPVGNIVVHPTVTPPGDKPQMTWSITLPADSNASDYTFHIRQVQLHFPSAINWDMQVTASGSALAPASVIPVPSRFELHAAKNTTPVHYYLLDSTTVGTYLPMATVKITSQDPYSIVPRTRADRPFGVQVTTAGIMTDPLAPGSAKAVTLVHHAQPYGPSGTGDPLDRTLATELSQTTITTNHFTPVAYPFASHSIPGENHSKARGEERFTIFTKADDSISANAIDSQLVQIWPVADASITGITQGQILGTGIPRLTCHLNDLYPSSTTWAQLYQGPPQDGFTGTIIPESVITINQSVPANSTITLDNYGALLTADGIWTMEFLTQTPFGTDRIARVTFIVNRTGTTIAEWRHTHFGSSSNTGDGADQNDYDHDGIPNAIEFAFGLDPKQNSAAQLPQPQHTAGQLALRFTPPAGITGIRYGAESSTTLQPDSWTPVPNTGTLPENLFTVPTAGKPSLYLRLTTDLVAP